jgi:carbonic anhydrase
MLIGMFSPYESAREDVAYLKSIPFLRQDVPIRGFVFDIKTGLVNPVDK